jgi:hypothetical protein
MGILNFSNNNKDTTYVVDPTRWYKSYPYGFAFSSFDVKRGGQASETFWLPIAPNNINVTTHYATNIITTLYGIVEEHSEVRYYDIVISGNTGIAPKYTVGFKTVPGSVDGTAIPKPGIALPNPNNPGSPSIGRSSFGSANKAALGGFLPEVANTFAAAANLVKSIKTGGEVVNETGIKPEQSGYYAFHNFYKFLLQYKADASRVGALGAAATLQKLGQVNGTLDFKRGGFSPIAKTTSRKTHPLQFLNYKDNIKYDCVPISFTLNRSAEHPMLYEYSIRLRAFNLQNVNAKGVPADNLLKELGLGSLNGSLFSKLTNVVGKASTLLSGVRGAL